MTNYHYMQLNMLCALLRITRTRGSQLIEKCIRKLTEEDCFLRYRGLPMPMPIFPKRGEKWEFDCLEVEAYLCALEGHPENEKGKQCSTRWIPFDDHPSIPTSVKKMREVIKSGKFSYETEKRRASYLKLKQAIRSWHRKTKLEAQERGMTLEEYCNLPEHNFEIEEVKI